MAHHSCVIFFMSNEQKPLLVIATGIYPPDIGGPATVAHAVARAFHERGVRVRVVAFGRGQQEQGIEVYRVSRWWPWMVRHILYTLRVWWVSAGATHLLALSGKTPGIAAHIAGMLRRIPVTVRIAGDYAWEYAIQKRHTHLLIDDFQGVQIGGWAGMLRRIQRWVVRRSAQVVVPSQYLQSIVQGWGYDSERIVIVPNAVTFSPSEISQQDARTRIGIPGTLIVSVGRLVPWKGFRMLIKIMPQLLELNQFFRLVIVGDGPERDVLRTMARNLGLEKKVFIVGAKSHEELPTYLAAADLFVLNTGYEGFSHQIIEAMAAGVPVITTTAGGNREIISQGENGLMVKYNDEFNLREAIRALWDMPELRAHMSEAGKATARLYDEARMREAWIKALHL